MPKGDVHLPREKGQTRDPRLPKRTPPVDVGGTVGRFKTGWAGLKKLAQSKGLRGGTR